jgi:hypothetical protein
VADSNQIDTVCNAGVASGKRPGSKIRPIVAERRTKIYVSLLSHHLEDVFREYSIGVMGCKGFAYTRQSISVFGKLLLVALELPLKPHTLNTQDINKYSSETHSEIVSKSGHQRSIEFLGVA